MATRSVIFVLITLIAMVVFIASIVIRDNAKNKKVIMVFHLIGAISLISVAFGEVMMMMNAL